MDRLGRLRWLAAGATIAVVMAACSSSATTPPAASSGSGAGTGSKPTIYIIAPSLTDPFWQTEKNGADQAAKDFNATVVFEAPAQDTGDAGMEQLLRAAIAAKPDGIAIDYTSKTLEAATTAALDAGIRVVLYNNNRFEGANAPSDARIPALSFVGQNEAVSGSILAQAFLPNLKTPGCTSLIVNPFPTAFVLTLRGNGVKKVLDANGFKYEDLAATGDEQQNLALIGAKLQQEPSICAIFGLGGPGANPAAKYVSDNKLSIPVATFDVGKETADYIAKGALTMAINQQPFLQSYYAVSDLTNLINYSLQPANIDTGTSIVTKDNIASIQACLAAGRC
ncbi:MAG: substrate-binding domain-containing protein [Candidatus Limnocylindrales bacterium]